MFFNCLLFVFTCFMLREVVSDCTRASICITDSTAESQCGPGEVFVPDNSHIFGCCPRCQPSSTVLPVDEDGCRQPSNCLEDGRYAPVQCKGDMFTGRCFCSNEDGNRLFGMMWRRDASEMTCACSRRRAELEAQGRHDVVLHCTSTGDYEPLQCDDGICWCADRKTGQPTITPMPEENMRLLPCYSAMTTGEQYLRHCESLTFAVGMINGEQSEHGTNFLGSSNTFCDYDGSYGSYQIVNGIAYCTDKAGEILGSWQVVASEMAGMNCNCARDTMIYFPENGMTVSEVCQGNGNYRPNQNVGDVYYCVDSDGYQTTELLDAWPADNCASYARRN